MENQKKEVLALALGIALLPPLWAVLAPYIGITTGAVALICSGLYVTNGNKVEDALKIMIGFWCGDLWAVISIYTMNYSNINPNLELFLTLCILGFLAVLIGTAFKKVIFLPAWLCGWAIGLTIISPQDMLSVTSLALQIAVAMAVGVWYVGAGVDLFTKLLIKKR